MTHPKPIEPGVYFGLDKAAYHLDSALGSGDLRRVLNGTHAFWWESKFNPLRPADKETDARIAGNAIHKIVLEGAKPFGKEFIRRPDDMPGASGSDKSANTKAAKKGLMVGQHLLHGEVFDRTLTVGASIAEHPDLATAFQGGMPEVSIFWLEQGDILAPPVMLKARIDYLKIRGLGDIKSIANELEMEFPVACRRAVRFQRMLVQVNAYMRGRAKIAGFFAAGAVHGDHDKAWLAKVAAAKDFAWQWVFYQRQGAPEVWSKTISPQNPLFIRAHQDVQEAIIHYQQALQEFGAEGKPWLSHEPVSELTEDELTAPYGAY